MAEEQERTEDVVKGGINKKIILIGLLALLLVGGGIGAFLMVGGDHEEKASSEKSHADVAEETPANTEEIGPVVDLEPFVLNLADRDQLRYLKVSIKLQLDRPEEETDFKDKLPAIRDALLVLLTSKESRSLRTIDGKMLVREEIGGRINKIMKKGKVRRVFFTEFIIQ
ncbi:MAG: flagellar basal body protein FliL [Nitrospirae bacterium]|nr:MAG: flagellar basal body protein FliL [Nitrospirota bacterium]